MKIKEIFAPNGILITNHELFFKKNTEENKKTLRNNFLSEHGRKSIDKLLTKGPKQNKDLNERKVKKLTKAIKTNNEERIVKKN